MRFNVKKCNVLHVQPGARSQTVRYYELCGAILSEVTSAKYLGVLYSNDLSWSPHIQSVAHKAHQRLGFIKRNLKGAPFRYRNTAYQSLVRAQLEYAAVVWDPSLHRDIDILEKVQRKAARWAKGQYGVTSVTTLLRDLKWDPLADRRQNQRLILMYKIMNSLIAIPPDKVDIQRATRPPRLPKNQDNLQRPRASTKSSPLWNSTIYKTIPQWNELPAVVAEADSLLSFKRKLTATHP